MDDLISRQVAIDAVASIKPVAKLTDGDTIIRMSAVNHVLNALPPAQPDRFCKTCYYIDEFLGGVFFCRRVKESKRVKPDFYCKKWRGEQNGRFNQQTGGY